MRRAFPTVATRPCGHALCNCSCSRGTSCMTMAPPGGRFLPGCNAVAVQQPCCRAAVLLPLPPAVTPSPFCCAALPHWLSCVVRWPPPQCSCHQLPCSPARQPAFGQAAWQWLAAAAAVHQLPSACQLPLHRNVFRSAGAAAAAAPTKAAGVPSSSVALQARAPPSSLTAPPFPPPPICPCYQPSPLTLLPQYASRAAPLHAVPPVA